MLLAAKGRASSRRRFAIGRRRSRTSDETRIQRGLVFSSRASAACCSSSKQVSNSTKLGAPPIIVSRVQIARVLLLKANHLCESAFCASISSSRQLRYVPLPPARRGCARRQVDLMSSFGSDLKADPKLSGALAPNAPPSTLSLAGTSAALGCRWPIGASGIPLIFGIGANCASADGPDPYIAAMRHSCATHQRISFSPVSATSRSGDPLRPLIQRRRDQKRVRPGSLTEPGLTSLVHVVGNAMNLATAPALMVVLEFAAGELLLRGGERDN